LLPRALKSTIGVTAALQSLSVAVCTQNSPNMIFTSSPDYVFQRFELFRETLCIPLNDVPFACGDEDTARNFCTGYTSDFACVNDCPDGCKDDDCPMVVSKFAQMIVSANVYLK